MQSSGYEMRRYLLAVLGVLAACADEGSWATYEDTPAGYVITVVHTSTPTLSCATDQMRQTTVRIELPHPPAHGETVDLSSAHVTYEYGGMRVGFHSEGCTGTLTLGDHDDRVTVRVSCKDPQGGEQRSLEETVPLKRRS